MYIQFADPAAVMEFKGNGDSHEGRISLSGVAICRQPITDTAVLELERVLQHLYVHVLLMRKHALKVYASRNCRHCWCTISYEHVLSVT